MTTRQAPKQWNPRAWPAIITGLLWLCAHTGFWPWLIGVVPGVLLLGSGTALLLWPGASRIAQGMALGAVVGVVLAVPALFVTGWLYGIVVGLLSAWSFLVAGREAQLGIELPESAEPAPSGWRTDVKAAIDLALVGYFVFTARISSGQDAQTALAQIDRFEAALKQLRDDDAALFGSEVQAPQSPAVSAGRSSGRAFEVVQFDSDYAPSEMLPEPPAWLQSPRNRRCRLRVFRQPQPGRPWLIGIHGYRMGADWLDLRLFPPRELVDRLQLNVVLPTLPLHGTRKAGHRSGDHYLDGQLLDLFHAQAQALRDLRRSVAWIRAQDPEARIGVLGYSLGGYNAALLAAHQDDLDFVVAGIPVAEFGAMIWQALPEPHRDYFERHGLDRQRYAALLSPLSPLGRAPRLPVERLAIFAGSADHVVPPPQPARLSDHWRVPIRWYPGGHLTFNGEPAVSAALATMMQAAGWTPPQSSAEPPADSASSAPNP